MSSTSPALLSVQDLTVRLQTPSGLHKVLDQVSLDVHAGRTLGLVGESGCGKSVTALAVMRLLAPKQTHYESGRILLDGVDLLGLTEHGMRKVRGHSVAMVFQEPMTSLNPVLSVSEQISEGLRVHRAMDSRACQVEVLRLLNLVGIAGAAGKMKACPHELSGGQRQRVMIAMALACQPKLLIADEPTTALDVTVQAQILRLLDDLRQEFNMGLLLVTHDLGLVADHCDDVVVMYAGRVAERRSVNGLFQKPAHPYTRALLHTSVAQHAPGTVLPTIAGSVPALGQRGEGCLFAGRCAQVHAKCHQAPRLAAIEGQASEQVACWLPNVPV